jgi:hypothetical protein
MGVDVVVIVPLPGFVGEIVPIGVAVLEDLTLVVEGLILLVVTPATVVGMDEIGERVEETGAGVETPIDWREPVRE